MTDRRIKAGKNGYAPALLAGAALLIAIPGAGLALGGARGADSLISDSITTFTPANVDPQLALRVALDLDGKKMRFTPAGGTTGRDRTITVAVRVDDATARAISIRSGVDSVQSKPGAAPVKIASTRYDLGISRGYRSFPVAGGDSASLAVKPSVSLPAGVRKLDMPDLADFRPSEGVRDKPSRFQPRIALETEQGSAGRTPATRDGLREQSVDVGGAYRISRNLDVTAGVRISQERDRLDPLTDSVQDSQAVYVGTKVRF